MLDKIIAFSINNKFIIGLMTLALIVWGAWSASKLPIDALPDITNNQVQIITLCPTLAGQEVEQLVTYPIEQSIANLPDVVELRSISRFGLSVVTVVFEDKVDIYFARQLVNEKLKEAEEKIPRGIGTPELAPVSTGLGEVYQYIIHPKKGSESKYTAMDLRTMQDWIVARQLYGTPGIAEVNSFGGQLKQYEVAVNPDRLVAMGISIPEIFTALERNNENTGGAYIDKKPNAYFIRGVGLIGSFEDIKRIAVKNNPNGIPILIGDVAEVRFGSAVRYGALTYNGQVDAVGGVVMMLKGSNSADVVNRVKEKMNTIKASLPDDVVIEPYLDRTDLVNRAISTVEKNLLEGALIVIFVLVLFLGNLRAGLIVASAIPLSMLFALGMMNLFGVSANLMSLGAIDFGLIVDGAVIIVESIFHRITTSRLKDNRTELSTEEMNETVLDSAKRMMKSAAFGQMIILIVYLPILSLVGIEGKMFGPMAQTVSFAILGAFILSLTYIPMVSALFLSRKIAHKINISDKMMMKIQAVYLPLLQKAIAARKIVIGTTAVVFIFTVVLFARMGGEFIPTLTEGDFAFHCILPQGTSLSQSIETSMQASRIVKQFDEVKMIVGRTGSAEVPTDPMPPEATDLMIILKQPDEWKRDITYEELAQEIIEELEVIPGVFFEKSQPIQMRFNELMTGIRQDVAIKIFGENMDTLLFYANKVNESISSVEGITQPSVERVSGLPQIVINYNRSQIANYGLAIEDINHIVSTAFAGGDAGVVFENERKFDLVVRLDSTHRNNIEDVSHLFIPTSGGNQIPLSQIADIKLELGPAQISREDGKRRIVVGFNVKGRDVESVVKEMQSMLANKVKLPEGYYFTYGGTFENLQAASARLMIAVPVALALIFILLYFTFTSVSQAVVIFTAIPMAAIGGVFALLVRDMPFSISAGVGFIALFGVAVLNGIVLISTFNQLQKDGVSDMITRIMEGTKIRLRPVLMTAAVASLGFLPMALSHGAGAEVQRPLATVVIGGLISATFLTLFVLPLLYLVFSPKRVSTSNKTIVGLIFVIISGFASYDSNAQTASRILSVEDAIKIALDSNLNIKVSKLNMEASQKLKKSFFELPKTEVSYQYGQFNSNNKDNSIEISQDIPFPTYYGAQSGLLNAQVRGSTLDYKASENELKGLVQENYFQLQYLLLAKKNVRQLDSLYDEFVRVATLRYNSGETNLLEKISAETKRSEISIQLSRMESEYFAAYNALKTLLNISFDFEVSASFEPLQLLSGIDSSAVLQNPNLLKYYQEAEVADRYAKLEIAQALPDIKLGYFNQSIIGLQSINGSETYFDSGDRFTGFSLGLNIPLTFFSNSSKANSYKLQRDALELAGENNKRMLQNQLERSLQNYGSSVLQYEMYKEASSNYIESLISTATLGFKNGEIGYMEYINALETAANIKIKYLQSINQINQSIVQINLLISK
ncbi:MAG: CusA/CzcA family heavy metal efflux RND transporter [Bacteroidia bacterium]|nr:CusA/CzcA family heavy metal efflux RND transporter [Bacteroidia bacterium]